MLAEEMRKLSKEFADNNITDRYHEIIDEIRKVASTTGKRYLITPDTINNFEWDKLKYEDGFNIIRMTGSEILYDQLVQRGDLMIEW